MSSPSVHAARVAGFCPACGSDQLYLLLDRQIVCSERACPRPDAAAEVLADRETEHVVDFAEGGFTVRHPLIERLDDALLTCQVHKVISRFDGPMFEGRYPMWLVDGQLDGAPVDEPDPPGDVGPSRPFPHAYPETWP